MPDGDLITPSKQTMGQWSSSSRADSLLLIVSQDWRKTDTSPIRCYGALVKLPNSFAALIPKPAWDASLGVNRFSRRCSPHWAGLFLSRRGGRSVTQTAMHENERCRGHA